MDGKVKRIHADKGFFFIRGDNGTEYFAHRSACRDVNFDELREGQGVRFTAGQGAKGPRAEDVSGA